MKFKISLVLAVLLSLFACEKNPGVGGDSSIYGTVYLYQMNDDYSLRINSPLLPAQDVDVYIQYGDDEVIQDKVETSPEGYFEFNNLYEGDYKILYYTENILTAERSKEALITDVSIADGESKEIGPLELIKSYDYDEGTVQVSGCVKIVSFTYNSVWPNMIPKDTLLAVDQPVFIRPLQHQAYADRIRTQGDGSFHFQNLIAGDYEIFVFSEDIKGSDQDVSIKDTISIEVASTATDYVLDDIIIYNL